MIRLEQKYVIYSGPYYPRTDCQLNSLEREGQAEIEGFSETGVPYSSHMTYELMDWGNEGMEMPAKSIVMVHTKKKGCLEPMFSTCRSARFFANLFLPLVFQSPIDTSWPEVKSSLQGEIGQCDNKYYRFKCESEDCITVTNKYKMMGVITIIHSRLIYQPFILSRI